MVLELDPDHEPALAHLAHRGQAPVDVRVGPDHLDRYPDVAAYYADKELRSFPRRDPHPWLFNNKEFLNDFFKTVEKTEQYDVLATLRGGGVSGQAGALRLGIARSLVELDVDSRALHKKAGFLTRDARVVERKKAGLKKARKASQFSKR